MTEAYPRTDTDVMQIVGGYTMRELAAEMVKLRDEIRAANREAYRANREVNEQCDMIHDLVNEWDFEKAPDPPATDAECEAIDAWVNELNDESDDDFDG